MIHTLLAALVLSIDPSAGTSTHSTVSVDMARLDRRTFDALDAGKFYQSLVLRFVKEGLAVIDPSEKADIAVELANRDDSNVVITAVTLHGQRSSVATVTRPLNDSTLLYLIQTSLVLVRKAKDDLDAAPTPAPPPTPETTTIERDPVPAVIADGASTRPFDIAATLHSSALRSATQWGALLSAEVAAERGPWSTFVGGSGHLPLGLSEHLKIREWGAYAGVGASGAAFAPWLTWRASLALGAWQQLSHYRDGAIDIDDSRWDPLLLARFAMAARFGAWRVGPEVGGVGVLHDRVYRTTTAPLWHAPQLRPFFGVVIDYVWDRNFR